MGIRFNADEVLEMAERIESLGAEFYRRAADLRVKAGQPSQADYLRQLAATEDRHRATFAGMRRDVPAAMREETAFDPYMEAVFYLQAMADGHGGEGAPAAADALTGKESMADIVRTAIGLEQKSILFYLGLREMVPPKLGRNTIDAIIAEEKDHLAALAAELRAGG